MRLTVSVVPCWASCDRFRTQHSPPAGGGPFHLGPATGGCSGTPGRGLPRAAGEGLRPSPEVCSHRARLTTGGQAQGAAQQSCYLTHAGLCLDLSASPASLQLPQDATLRLHIRLRGGENEGQ